jgi:hypothetical protein
MTTSNHHPTFCKFCGKEASYEPLDIEDNIMHDVFFCHHCSVEYIYWNWESGHAMHFSIYKTFNNKMYRWSPYGSTAHLWLIRNPGIPGTKRNENLELIKTFRGNLPNITPDNFVDKLSVYLLFI